MILLCRIFSTDEPSAQKLRLQLEARTEVGPKLGSSGADVTPLTSVLCEFCPKTGCMRIMSILSKLRCLGHLQYLQLFCLTLILGPVKFSRRFCAGCQVVARSTTAERAGSVVENWFS